MTDRVEKVAGYLRVMFGSQYTFESCAEIIGVNFYVLNAFCKAK